MAFHFDAYAALASIQSPSGEAATVAIPATVSPQTTQTVAAIATVAGGASRNDNNESSTVAGLATVATLPLEIVEEWEERAAIREYNGNQHREQAEIGAAAELGLNVIDLRAEADRLRSGHRSVSQHAEGSGYEQAS